MKRSIALIACALLVALATASAVLAQTKPDFSGVWILDSARSDPAPAGRGGPGSAGGAPERVNIKQTDVDITIGEFTYKFDGTEVKVQGGRGGEVRGKASWNGSKLVITATVDFQGGTVITNVQERSLEADGKEMIVVNKTTLPSGDLTRKLVYKKS
jgi:hypothetical protein